MKKIMTIIVMTGSVMFNTIQAQVTPLLTTTWNQGCYYNADCPPATGGPCGKAYTGCGATAWAQVFKFYSFPSSGMGSHCNTNNTSHCVIFSNQTYTYSLMPNQLSTYNTEVAKLMYHIGVAVNMQWSASNSSSLFGHLPIKRYFMYSPKMYGVSASSFGNTANLINAIKNELSAGKLVFASGNNHFYIIDGYNLSNQFHCNFGWGGTYDGYYDITSVVTGYGNFTPTQFIFNIRPLDGDLEVGKDTISISATTTSGVFEFTSKLNWTISSSSSWLIPNLIAGNAGYFNAFDGCNFTVSVNNGGLRYGYIYVQNTNDTDTIVIKQEASPLVVSPDTLFFSDLGTGLNANITFNSFWSASSPDSWISILPNSGFGNTNISVSCSQNILPINRISYIVVSTGVLSDSIIVLQNAANVTDINNLQIESGEIELYPNPTSSFIYIKFNTQKNTGAMGYIYNVLGELVKTFLINDSETTQIDLSNLTSGIYFVAITNPVGQKQYFKVIKK